MIVDLYIWWQWCSPARSAQPSQRATRSHVVSRRVLQSVQSHEEKGPTHRVSYVCHCDRVRRRAAVYRYGNSDSCRGSRMPCLHEIVEYAGASAVVLYWRQWWSRRAP
jgi:hypothetical protein